MKLLHETRSGSSECGSVSVNHIKVQSIKLLVPTKTFRVVPDETDRISTRNSKANI